MFGLKLVRKQDYTNLKRELTDSQALLAEKYGIIKSLESEIKKLNDKIADLEKQTTTPQKTSSKVKKIELLTDVAEEPLKVEQKTTKRRRFVKKTTKSE